MITLMSTHSPEQLDFFKDLEEDDERWRLEKFYGEDAKNASLDERRRRTAQRKQKAESKKMIADLKGKIALLDEKDKLVVKKIKP